jgi:hypothetical protein
MTTGGTRSRAILHTQPAKGVAVTVGDAVGVGVSVALGV